MTLMYCHVFALKLFLHVIICFGIMLTRWAIQDGGYFHILFVVLLTGESGVEGADPSGAHAQLLGEVAGANPELVYLTGHCMHY